ncbi:Protein EXPORTIN 1A [Abeliophyllum distichum]|uniref:Protein EXPORTIN 1A n=1 Tax=Abeliophyllum distichum TaxID=126358 RepID=A0ABD1RXN8_9LAMI
MEESKRGLCPIGHGIYLSKEMCPKTQIERDRMDRISYASAIGSIMYAMLCTRPDVSYALSVTSRFQANPGEKHWIAVKNILKYLRRTKDMFLVYGENELRVQGYADASFQSDKDDSKSQSGYVFTLNGGAVSWKSSKQETTADSTTEAEYIAASEAAKEAVWIKKFITELGIVHSIVDQITCIVITMEPSHKRRNTCVSSMIHIYIGAIYELGGKGQPYSRVFVRTTVSQGFGRSESEWVLLGFNMAAEKLRDLSQAIDVALLDATVAAFYGTGSQEERTAADHILRELQTNPDMWLQVVHILHNAQILNTKFFALQVLEGVIKYRWNALPVAQRDGMKNYISDVIVKLSTDEISFRQERLYVNKLNVILVQILKHEWPGRWQSFIPDLVAAAKTSETILLSEEVFDFSRGELTQQKIKELKQSLNREFQLIHELCAYVLSASQRAELIRATLATLHAFLSWIPLGYIFESPLLETLLKLFPVLAYRNLTLQCLTEVAALSFGYFYNMQPFSPPSTNFPEAYGNGNSEEQAFIQNLALFFTSFYKSHIRVLESTQENKNALLTGLEYLINISYVDVEVSIGSGGPGQPVSDEARADPRFRVETGGPMRVCLDYWNSLVLELFEAHHNLDNPETTANMMGLQMPMLPHMVDGLGSQLLQRQQLYAGSMSKLRSLMICCMAKPEEVLIVEDENGNIVRETMRDNDVLLQYKTMRETLIYLAHLDHEDTEKQVCLTRVLSLSVYAEEIEPTTLGEDRTWNNLNTLCWAIGSISGSMGKSRKTGFLVMVICDLLNLCEISRGKDNKAVIASNIMYVVGQYPRFLRTHWKFLKTVVTNLFGFMHETHPGVQDMACDTFLKIVQKCRHKFVVGQVGENEPFISELLTSLPVTITDLQPHQIHTFYESVGHMIQGESNPQKRDEYIQRLMELPNQKWAEMIRQARESVDFLKDQNVIRAVLNILQTNTSVASSLGTYFLPQISVIFLDMLNVYRMYSELISTSIVQGGPYASRTSIVKLLRSVKRETLKLIETFLDKAEDQPHIGKQYKGAMIEDVPRIFEAIFQCTLKIITKNFEDYPEHRLKFFSLLRAIATHCFLALINTCPQQLKLVMDSIIWAFRHTERNIAETGLNLSLEMLKNFQASEFCNQFYKTYFLTIEQEIFAVLTDSFHKPGFKLHVLVLQHLFCLVESGGLTEPLWDVAAVPYSYPNNALFIREYTVKLLSTSFPNMATTEVTKFVNGLFESRVIFHIQEPHT